MLTSGYILVIYMIGVVTLEDIIECIQADIIDESDFNEDRNKLQSKEN